MGHNARTCISKKAVDVRNVAKKPKKTLTSNYVPVQMTQDVIKSPHVVLLDKQQKPQWSNVDVYCDVHQQKKHTRQTVDFAALVREANKKSPQEDVVVPVEDVKKYTPRTTKDFDILSEITRLPAQKSRFQQRDDVPANVLLQDLKARDGVDAKTKVRKAIKKPFEPIVSAHAVTKEKINNFVDRLSVTRFAVSVAILLMIIALPFPAMGYVQKIQSDTHSIIEKSTHAFLSLQSSTVAAFSHNIPQAQYDLNEALSAFGSAEEIIDREYKALVYVARLLPFVGSKVKSRQELLLAGHNLALGNTYLVKGLDDSQSAEDASLADRMSIIRHHVRSALPQYREALDHLNNVSASVVPTEYQESFEDFRTLFAGFITDMENMDHVIQGVEQIMGADGFKRYLILFQNHHEMRPTGGFVGSYATVDVQNGKILNIDVPGGGSYDVQGQLDVYVKPPVPLQLVNSRWEFQDGNWFPDFKTSAEKMAWFYRHSRDTTVDGVIAINATVLPRLLSVLGPIQHEERGLLLAAEDVLPQLQAEVTNYDNLEENTPKAVLSELLDQILNTVGEVKPAQTMTLVTELQEALTNKEIQFYFDDEQLQNLFYDYGWTGEIIQQEKKQDYLMAVHTNLGGKKSDAEIKQHVYHEAVVQDDGSIIDTVVIRREHEGNTSAEFFDHPNVGYMRLYVPEGAELIDAGGFTFPDEAAFAVPPRWYQDDADVLRVEQHEDVHVKTGTRITNEFGKTAFGNWIVTMPGEVTEVYFTYKLPFTIYEIDKHGELAAESSLLDRVIPDKRKEGDTSRYSVVLQKQSGVNSTISHAIIYPDGWRPIWKTGTDELNLSINGGSIEKDFKTDEIFGILMRK